MTDITTTDPTPELLAETAGDEEPRVASPVVVSDELAAQLVEQARVEGLDLVGPGELLSDLTKRVLEAGLEGEMSLHVGYDKHDPEGRNGGNSRNGTRSKTVITVRVPRSHLGGSTGPPGADPGGCEGEAGACGRVEVALTGGS